MMGSEPFSGGFDSGPGGSIYTFYSFKGGTGRTMALANLAVLLARSLASGSRPSVAPAPRGVLMIDWDLEAPGLHHFFRKDIIASQGAEEFNIRPGLIELFREIRRVNADTKSTGTDDSFDLFRRQVDLGDFISRTNTPHLFLMKAGAFTKTYARNVRGFNWKALHQRLPRLFVSFAAELSERFDYVLIDSRTGVTDIGGICTALLPEKLIVVFTPNRQSLEGAIGVAQEATRYRKESTDIRPLNVFPLPSRIEPTEPRLLRSWRYGDAAEGVKGYQPLFQEFFKQAYDLPECNLEAYFDDVQIQHVPHYSYGEEIAVESEHDDRLSISRSYERFADRLANLPSPWALLTGAPDLARAAEMDDSYGAALAGPGSLQVDVRGLVADVVDRGNIVFLRSLIRRTRSYFASAWPDRIEELNRAQAERGIAEAEIFDYASGELRNFSPEAAKTEQLGLAIVDAEYLDALPLLTRVLEDWITLSERTRSGRITRAVVGAPGLVALRCFCNWGAKAIDNQSFRMTGALLGTPVSTDGTSGEGRTAKISERTDLFFSEGMLGRADLTVRYIERSSWEDRIATPFFAGQEDYRDGLSVFLFLITMLGNEQRPDRRPLYPGFKLIPGSPRAIRSFIAKISGSGSLPDLAELFGEDVATFRTRWSERVKIINEAQLGYRYDFGSEWPRLPPEI
jgi:MinD-like ATPase involved in chromosome partitioning or flagellar assembly